MINSSLFAGKQLFTHWTHKRLAFLVYNLLVIIQTLSRHVRFATLFTNIGFGYFFVYSLLMMPKPLSCRELFPALITHYQQRFLRLRVSLFYNCFLHQWISYSWSTRGRCASWNVIVKAFLSGEILVTRCTEVVRSNLSLLKLWRWEIVNHVAVFILQTI